MSFAMELQRTSFKEPTSITEVVIFPVLNSSILSPPRCVGPDKLAEAATSAKVYSAIPVISF